MMMAEGSSEVLVGLKVTRYFSHGENSMNCNTMKKVINTLIRRPLDTQKPQSI
jgi:hypothetical protein